MAKFKVEYASGKVEVTDQSDCDTIDQFMNVKFGTAKTEAKVSIVGVKAEEPKAKAEEPKVKTPVKK